MNRSPYRHMRHFIYLLICVKNDVPFSLEHETEQNSNKAEEKAETKQKQHQDNELAGSSDTQW